MAMAKCKECKGDVSTGARKCPHCGVDNPTTTTASVLGGMALIGLMAWALVTCVSSSDDSDAPAGKTPEQIAAEEAQCKTDLQCWGDKHQMAATIKCKRHVERLAKHSFEWTDAWHETKFSHFRWLNKGEGTVTFIGDKIKFQNAFGAWTNAVYECDCDPTATSVLAARAEAGRL